MTPIHQALINRFGKHRIVEIPVGENEMPLLALNLETKSPVTVIVTNGLSNYKMPVPENLAGFEFNELYFCLPSYWNWEEVENPQMNWIFPWIQRLAKHVVEKNSWFGHGHTIPCGKEMHALSNTMLQNHFFLSQPILLENELAPISVNEKMVHFLAIIPIFGDEMDYKQGKGTLKLMRKFLSNGITEKLDDYRGTVLRSKWRFFKPD